MNPEKPSREQIEARLTALLLGELPAEEAALLRWTISQDAELVKLHDQLQVTIGFVREATAHPTETSAEKAVRRTLTEERRQKLLAHFKTPRPHTKDPIFWLKRIEVPRLVLALAAVAIIAVLAAMMLPALSKAKSKSTRVAALAAARMLETEGLLAANESGDSSAANLPAIPPSAPSGVITYAPEPTLAPPPTTIVLPQPEESRDLSMQAGTSAIMLPDGNGNTPSTVHFRKRVPPVASEKPQPTVNFATTPAVNEAAAPDRMPAAATASAPQLAKAKQDAAKLVQDGRALYETGKIKESEAKLNQALNLDSENSSAYYYMNLNQQADLARNANAHTADTQARLALVEKQRVLPSAGNRRSPTPTLPDQNQNNLQAQKDALDSFGAGTDLKSSTDQRGDLVAGVVSGSNMGGGGFGGSGGGGGGRGGMGGMGGGMGGGGNPFAAQFGNSANNPSAVASRQKTSRETASPRPDSKPINLQGGTPVTVSSETAGNRSRTVTEDNLATLGANTEGSINGSSAAAERWGDFQGKAQNEIASSGRQTQMQATKAVSVDADRDFDGKTVAPQNQGDVFQNQVAKTEANKSSDPVFQWNLGSNHVRSDGVVASDRSNLGADKVPILGDLPELGQKFTSRSAYLTPSAPVVAPPPTTQVTSSLRGFYDDNFVATAKELPQTGGGSPSVSGPNNYARGTVVVGGKLAVNNNGQPTDTSGGTVADSGSFALDMVKSSDQGVSTFHLDNADPQPVMEVLHDMFQASGTPTGASTIQNGAVQPRKSNTTTTSANTSTSSRSSGPGGAVAGNGNLSVNNGGPVGSTTISADQLTHNRVIVSDQETEKQVREAIAKLGGQPQQRLIDGAVMDVSATNSFVAGDFKVDPNNFYSGLTRDDGSGFRYLYSSNAVVVEAAKTEQKGQEADKPLPKPAPNAPVPQPEVLARDNNFSTFSLNVSDVSFKLAQASLEKGQLPDTASIRSEEFINAFDYRDPEAAPGQPLAFASERARYPFAINRDLLRFSVKTAAAGRPAGRALNLVLLLDNSGSMERADRVAIIREALRVLATQLQPQDTVSIVTFARTARLWADGVSGSQAGEMLDRVLGITPEGGTNLEEAMRLAYETARRHYLANGMNRVVLITDGAANLGDVNPAALKLRVEAQRQQGIALDCFGVGFEDFNDDLLQQLSSNGDGRYAFLNSSDDANTEFAAKLAGALQVAAQDVKVQVEFNPQRVVSWRQIGYAKHQLTKEQFRDNTVDAAEIAAQEAGNALYTVETKPDGIGPVATVRVRYKVPGTREYRERSWDVAYEGNAPALDQASPAMRLAGTASAFSEWLAGSAFAQQVTLDELQQILGGVPQVYGADQRPAKLAIMLREAKSAAGQPSPAGRTGGF
jgi:Mg-chelatase subunit ChlD/type II secretory pathway pseudopilin PulG